MRNETPEQGAGEESESSLERSSATPTRNREIATSP